MGQIKSLKYINPKYQVRVDWMLTMRCNFDCSYCTSHDNTKPFNFKQLNEYITALAYLQSYFGNRRVNIHFLGGEPTLFKEWPYLINWLYKNDWLPEIVSNLSIPVNTYINKLDIEAQGEDRQFISGSYHPEFTDDNLFIENALQLEEKGFLKVVSVLAQPTQWKKVENIYNKLKDKCNVNLSRLRIERSDIIGIFNKYHTYTPEQEKLISNNIQEDLKLEVILEDGTKIHPSIFAIRDNYSGEFKGMKCAVGRDRIHIDEYGDVFPSACLMNFPRARMGNIFKQNLIKPGGPVVCPFNKCGCGPDIKIEKWA